jgi:ribosomal protein S18 acetylase RimI-like enzyme
MMTVRRLQPEDAPLALAAVRILKPPAPAPGVGFYERFLARPENILVVATDGPQPTGFLLAYLLDRLDGDRQMVCLYEINVCEPYRRRGVGRAMIEVLKAVCGQVEARKMWLLTNRSNEAAVHLYESTGARADDAVLFTYGATHWTGE